MAAARQHNMTVFLKKYGTQLASALNNQPLFFSLIWAQASLESGYGSSPSARNKNNFFGVYSGGSLKTFDSPEDAFIYQAQLFQKPNLPYVANGVPTATTPYTQLRAIANSGYYSMTNDETLGGNNVVKGTVWNGYTWNGNKWAGSNFTAQQSSDHYYNNLKGFIDDALLILPIGKVNSQGLAQIESNISNTIAKSLS